MIYPSLERENDRLAQTDFRLYATSISYWLHGARASHVGYAWDTSPEKAKDRMLRKSMTLYPECDGCVGHTVDLIEIPDEVIKLLGYKK